MKHASPLVRQTTVPGAWLPVATPCRAAQRAAEHAPLAVKRQQLVVASVAAVLARLETGNFSHALVSPAPESAPWVMMALTYRKTAKGCSEIETRAHRLTQRLRGILILIDGRRDVNDLRPLIAQQPDEALDTLSGQGFIEIVGAPAPPPPAALAPSSVSAAAPAGSRPAGDFDSTRRAAVRALNDLIGPASETMAIRMERARNLSELLPILVQAAQTIAVMRGRAAAQQFAQRFGVG